MKRRGSGHTDGGGSVLILTLWVLFFLGALALAVGSLVSADLRLATDMKARMTASMLARAGVERAAMSILYETTNWNARSADKIGNRPDLFRNNDRLPGGVFSVTYLFRRGNGSIVTNYGVLRESWKVDLNRGMSVRKKLEDLGIGTLLAEAILTYPETKKKSLAREGGSDYPAIYQSLNELLAVEGVTADVFDRLRPFVTVYRGETYGGVAEGKALQPETGDVLARQRIEFVFDRRKRKFVYWHEY